VIPFGPFVTTAGRWALPLCLVFACAHRAAPVASASAAMPPPDAGPSASLPGDAGALPFAALPPSDSDSEADAGEAEDEDSPEEEGAPDMERESHAVAAPGTDAGPRYTTDLSDAELARRWKDDLPSLGSISMGFADEGRMINSVPVPEGEDHLLVSPDKAFGTTETIEQTLAAIRRVRELHPSCPPLRINNISGKEGGYLRPHHSHQSGRDVDLGFYYPTVEPIRERKREKVIDVALNWELVKALATRTDVELILVDRRVQQVLYDYALAAGEDKAWLDSLFHAGMGSLLFHARGHRDHFHVRFYNPRAQELGRRVAPLLAQRPDENRAFHRVRQGDTLGALARHYGSSVAGIQKVNHLKGTMLHLSQLLQIPLRGPCTQCPIPAPVIVPPRRLPPVQTVAAPTGSP
jgi:murein endopeptidase